MTGPAQTTPETPPGTTPIFVLGSARSGTTWLGNLLSCHPAIAGAHHRVHWGSAESRIYLTEKHAGDLTDDRRFIQFMEVFAASDYFRLIRGDKERCYQSRPETYYELFLELMDRFAEKEGTRYWVTKLDPHFFHQPDELERFWSLLQRRYATVKLVGITREFDGVLRSYLNMEGQRSIHRLQGIKRAMAVMLESGRYVAHNRAITRLVEQRGGVLLRFEDLRADRRAAAETLRGYLELDFADSLDTPYRPNSSHGTRRDATTRTTERLALDVLLPLFRACPGAATSLLRLRERTRGEQAPFYWRLLRLEHMPGRFASELGETGQTALRRELFDD